MRCRPQALLPLLEQEEEEEEVDLWKPNQGCHESTTSHQATLSCLVVSLLWRLVAVAQETISQMHPQVSAVVKAWHEWGVDAAAVTCCCSSSSAAVRW